MKMRNRTIASLVAVASAAVAVTTMTTAPASAYNPDPRVIQNDSALTVYCPCRFSDDIDGTYFQKDDGGVGRKVVFGNQSGYALAKVEFHPYDEILWMYDVANDNDGLYYKVSYEGDGGRYGVYMPPGSSDSWDVKKVNLDIPEGRRVTITVYDDRGLTDHVSTINATA
ncbi:hypothetical protein [Streptomyces mutabilis]|uniref:hypothetical protein n=1 Tax=Streptomyces mutabilis TaxID=67332 RepID=UPI000693BA8F|nr:hypothetical protein [Streptomyces mutabilis]